MFWILIFAALLSALYLLTIKRYKYWERKGVTQKFVLPPLGDNLKIMLKRMTFYDMVVEIYNRFPEERYTGLYAFLQPVLMLRDPQLIRQTCVKDFEHFLDHRPFIPEDSDPLWNKNLFSLSGQKWKEMRATLSPSFTGSKMRQMFVLMHKTAENFVNFLSENTEEIQEIELKDAFTRYTNDVIASTAFGIHCDSLKDRENEFFTSGRRASSFTGFWKNIKFMVTMIMPFMGKVLKTTLFDEEISTFFRRIVRETMEYREKNKIERPDMINLLMNARKEIHHSGEEPGKIEESNFAAVEEHLEAKIPHKAKMDLTLDDITSQALIFFFAGFETVSSAMCFIAYELATNPDVQEKLIEELDEFRAANNTLTYEGLSKLTYLDMVFSETLRKWPPTIVTDRRCVKPYTIEPEKPNETSVHLTEQDTLWIPIWALHRDPKYWENPDKFDPERFSPENKDKIVPYTYMPFGVGPRNCIGSRFAIIEVKAVFYELLAHFEIVPTKKSSIPFVASKTGFNLSSANGFWFGLKKRKSTNL